MANRITLLCLVTLCLTVNFIECRGGRSSGSHSSGSRSSGSHGSWGRSWGSSSHSYSKPSSSSSGWFSSSSSGHHSYPSSSSGLSGSSHSSSSYGTHGYPSSSSGLSGTGSGSHSYPPSSGWSGYGTHSYPSSSSGLSGYGSSYPSHSSGSHSNYKPSGYGYGSYAYGSSNNYDLYGSKNYKIPQYYQAPQYVYVQEYRTSGSRYGDLLSGLTLYNMGRSHNNYHDHYYNDDYYRRRYHSPSSYTSSSSESPKDEAICTLRIKEDGKLEILKIPCEIVSTFTEGSNKVKVNETVCVTNSTMLNSTLPTNSSSVNTTVSSNITTCTSHLNGTDPMKLGGNPVDPTKKKMECDVDIKTGDVHLRSSVDCEVLLKYSKMPEPNKSTGIMPTRNRLKSLLANPPWWMSFFIAL